MQLRDVVDNRFEIEARVGAGGMGEVFRANDTRTGARVAVKVLHDRTSSAAERFIREARVLASLDHPAIVRYVSHGASRDGELFLAMEWLEGEDLAQHLSHSGLTVAESIQLVTRAAEALASAHALGIVHRDIKPSNLFLVGGKISDVRVLDFGIARHDAASRAKTRTGTMLGTLGYMAPEQARGDRQLDARADVFSLGCVLFECLTGRPAFAGENVMAVLAKVLLESTPHVRDVRPELDESLDALLSRMLAKSPDARPNDAALLSALANLATQSGAAPSESLHGPSTITAGELQLLCVVAARDAVDPRSDVLGATIAVEDEDASLRSLREVARSFGATIDRLADGSLVSVMRREGAATDRVVQAARCALALRSHLPNAQIVVATGRGLVSERVPVGEVIDAAARMFDTMASGGTSQIRIDDVTAGLLDARFEVAWNESGPELRAERGTGENVRRLLGRATPCVGRERDLEQLESILSECISEPRAGAVLVTAPAGYGKSRVLQELTRSLRAREESLEIWTARGDAMTAGAAFGLLGQVIRSAAGIVGSEPDAVRVQKLRARVLASIGEDDVDRIAPFLGELAAVAFPENASPQFASARNDPARMGDLLARAFEDWVLAEVAIRPVLIVFEDLHWGDMPTVRFVDAALRAASDRPFAVLAMARPEVHQVFPRLWSERRVHEVRLSELTKGSAEKLVRVVLGDSVENATVARIVAQAGGNAFYLEELIRAVAEGRGESLPQTVVAMAQARIEAFEPGARRVLRAASVFGETFWDGAMTELLGHDTATSLASSLDHLVGKEAIVRRPQSRMRGQREFAFRHALVCEAAYGMFTDEDRALAHRLAGAWLETHGEQNALTLAEHYLRGGDRARAGAWFHRAAEGALKGSDPRGVIDPAERAIECGVSDEARGELRAMQAHAHNWSPSPPDSKRCAREALALLPQGGPWFARAACELAQSCSVTNDVPGMHEVARVFEQVRIEEDPRRVAPPLSAGMVQFAFTGQLALMQRLMPMVDRLDALLAHDDVAARASLGLFRMSYNTISGHPEDSVELIAPTVRGFDISGDARNVAITWFSGSQTMTSLGLWDEVARMADLAFDGMRRTGLFAMSTGAAQYQAIARAYRGESGAAIAMMREMTEQIVALGIPPVEQACRVGLSTVLALGGDLAGALDEAMKVANAPFGWAPVLNDARARAASLLLALGRPREALSLCDEAFAKLPQGIMTAESLLRTTRAEAFEALGEADEARKAFDAANRFMLDRAAKLRPELREAFLVGLPENKRLAERMRRYAGG